MQATLQKHRQIQIQLHVPSFTPQTVVVNVKYSQSSENPLLYSPMPHHVLNNISHYLHHHPEKGILFAFIMAFLESLPLIGTLIPGSITMTAVGAMIGAGLIPGYLTLAIASLGAFLGDIVGFAMGRIFKDQLRNVWPFRKYPKIISVSETFIKKHGGKSILIGRFVGAVRSAVPMVAGLLRLSWIRFMVAALPTAILWAILYSLPGIILGAFSMEIPPKLLTEYIVSGIIFIGFLWLLYWIIQHFFTNITQFYHKQIDRYWAFLQTHQGSNLLIKLIYNRQHPACHHQLSRLLLAMLCCILFIITLINVALHSTLTHINAPVFSLAQSLRIYHLDPFFVSLSLIGEPTIIMLIAFVLSFILICARQWRAATHLTFATVITAAITALIKHANFSTRPNGFMIVKDSASFPSGHTVMSIVVLGLLAFYTAQYFKNNRGIINTVTSVLIALIATSRLYVGAHWLLDVIASVFLGLTILLLTIISYQRLPQPHSALNMNRWLWVTWMLIVSLGLWSGNIYFEYHHAIYRYTPSYKKITTTEANWWENPLRVTPLYRDNRLGYAAEPLNIQWSGDIALIQQTLKKQGWLNISTQPHIQDTVNRLASNKAQYHLPLFAVLYKNSRPDLIMYKNIPKQSTIYLLRLWNAHVDFNNPNILWIGMINKFAAPHNFITFSHHHLMSFTHLNVKTELYGNQNSMWLLKAYHVAPAHAQTHIKKYNWDGTIWLIKPKMFTD